MADVLIINGERVDLYDKDQAGLTFAVNHLGDMTDRDGGYSQSMKVPKSDRNTSIFGYAHSLVSNTRKQYTKLKCQYYSGGVQLIGAGYAVILDAGKEYGITLYSGNTSLFQAIDGLKLSDLDLSSMDLLWDFAGIVSMYSNAASPTCILVDNGNVSSALRTIEASEMFFHLFYKDIISAIISGAGFTKSGLILTDDEYRYAIFPFVNEYPKQGLIDIEESLTKAVNTTTEILVVPPSTGFSDVVLTFADDSIKGYDVNGNYDPLTGLYIAPHSGKIKVKSHLVILVTNMIANTTGTLCFIRILVNGVQVAVSETLLHQNANNNAYNYLDFEIEVEVQAGDTIQLSARTYNPVGAPVGYGVFIVTGDDTTNGKSYFQFDLDERLLWGGMWRHSRNLPDMSQKDFLKMFCQHFGQSLEIDEFSNTVNFFNVDEVIALKGLEGSLDFSQYYDSGSASIRFKSSYGQSNECKFTKDDNVTEFLGDGSFTIDDETLKEKYTAIQLPVAASETVSRLQGVDMAELLRFDIDGKEVTPKPRILRRVNTPLNPSGTSANYIRIIEAGTANAHDFFTASVGLFTHTFTFMLDRYYTGWIEVLGDYKGVTGNFLIPPSVVQQFSFTKPIYISELSSWFYVNKIENYKQGKLCKVDLQRI